MGNYCLTGPESLVYKIERVLEMDDGEMDGDCTTKLIYLISLKCTL